MLRAHYAFQHGLFVSQVEEIVGGLYASSRITRAPMWNHAAWIEGDNEEFQSLLRNVMVKRATPGCPTVLYVSDPTETQLKELDRYGYSEFDREAWLVSQANPGRLSDRIIEIKDAHGVSDFAAVFSAAFSAKEQGFRAALQNKGRHFVLYENGEAVSVGTLIVGDFLGCIYNVGTLPEVRGKGYGKELVEHLLAVAGQSQCRAVFLQVDDYSPAKTLYEKLGFERAFARRGYRLPQKSEPSRVGLLTAMLGGMVRRSEEAQLCGRETRSVPVGLMAKLEASFAPCTGGELLSYAWAYLIHRYTGLETVSFDVATANKVQTVSIQIERVRPLREWLRTAFTFNQAGTDQAESLLSIDSEKKASDKSDPSLGLEIRFRSESPDEIEVWYRRERFEKETIRRIAAHLTTVLESMLGDPNRLVRDLELLSDAEKQQLLVTWNESNVTLVSTTTAKLFEEQVERTPDAIAVVTGDVNANGVTEQLTYRQLNRRANRLAHRLQALDVGPEVPVVILLDRSIEAIVSLIAVRKAGGVCVPLDPSFPEARLSYILQDLEARVLVSRRRYIPQLVVPRSVASICIEDETAGGNEKNPIAHILPEHAAYIIYTSGSTGNPKGVVVPECALANHLLDCRKAYGLSSKDRVLQFSAFTFDASFEQIFPTLVSGASLVVRGEEVWTPRGFFKKLQELQLTVADVPTPYWHELVEYLARHPEDLPPNCLRLMIVGGEALSPQRRDLWHQSALSGVRLINAYGPTEATITATSYEVPRASDKPYETANLPIGRPRGGRKLYVLDAFGSPVPIGVPGELHIGGPMLARGYHKQPQLTQSRFIPNPFTDDPEERLYRTGDLVRYLEDGNLEFLGRIDDQVKVRGFRIELGEIESALRRQANVRDAIAIAKPDGSGEKRLVAYVVGSGVSSGELREHLRGILPEYMVPPSIVVLKEWPLLPNGKVDRRSLPEPDRLVQEQGRFSGPRDALELRLQLLFERVLNRASIGVDQSFFELGGDSLQALELLVLIEKETGRQLPLSGLYRAASVAALAGELRNSIGVCEGSSLVPLRSGGNRPALFLIHTTPGDILGYGNLVYRLGPEQPCYGFQSLGLKQASLAHRSIDEMARYYVDLLQHQSPHGPYYLAGWCYGGVVAVEMARLLVKQGQTVGLLALLETVAMPARFANYRYYLHRSRCLLRMSPGRWVNYVREKIKYCRESRLANRMRFRQVDSSGDPGRDSRLLQLEQVYNANLAALRRYRSSFYDGTVTLFNAAERDPALIPDSYYGWVGLAKEIEVFEVPGNHDTMLTEPNVSVLARRLTECLERAQERLSR